MRNKSFLPYVRYQIIGTVIKKVHCERLCQLLQHSKGRVVFRSWKGGRVKVRERRTRFSFDASVEDSESVTQWHNVQSYPFSKNFGSQNESHIVEFLSIQ